MSKYVVGAVILFLIGFISVDMYRASVATDKVQAEAAELKAAVARTIQQIAVDDGAVSDWPAQLRLNGKRGISPVLTAELQRVWISGTPILFVGKVNDITRNDDGTYQVFAEYTARDKRPNFMTVLQVKLDCPAQAGEELLDWMKRHPKAPWTDIAITGTIHTVEQSAVADDAAATSGLTGRGNCKTVMPIPR